MAILNKVCSSRNHYNRTVTYCNNKGACLNTAEVLKCYFSLSQISINLIHICVFKIFIILLNFKFNNQTHTLFGLLHFHNVHVVPKLQPGKLKFAGLYFLASEKKWIDQKVLLLLSCEHHRVPPEPTGKPFSLHLYITCSIHKTFHYNLISRVPLLHLDNWIAETNLLSI